MSLKKKINLQHRIKISFSIDSCFLKLVVNVLFTILQFQAEQDRTTLTKRVQDIEQQLYKKEELRLSAQIKLGHASESADDAKR